MYEARSGRVHLIDSRTFEPFAGTLEGNGPIRVTPVLMAMPPGVTFHYLPPMYLQALYLATFNST